MMFFKQIWLKHLHPIQRYPAASNTFSQQSQKASPATPLMPDIYEKHGKIDLLRGHHIWAARYKHGNSLHSGGRCEMQGIVQPIEDRSFSYHVGIRDQMTFLDKNAPATMAMRSDDLAHAFYRCMMVT